MPNQIEVGELLTNNTQNFNIISENTTKEIFTETIQYRKVKELLDEDSLLYVSDNIRKLFNITKLNNTNCFKQTLSEFIKDCTVIHHRLKVILYLRLSDEDIELADIDKDKRIDLSRSIKNQLLMLLEYAFKRNWEVVGIFCEEDLSGADETRPEWNLSLKLCEHGNADVYISKTQARFARSIEMTEKYLHKLFAEWKIRFIGLVDNIDTDNRATKKTSQITAMTDEWRLEDQSINMKETLRAKKKLGIFTGSFAPYGYMKNPKDKYHLVIDPVAAKVVRLIYKMYKNGDGFLKIAKELNKRKIPTPSSYKKLQGLKYICPAAKGGRTKLWNIHSVRIILKNEVYDGTLIQNKSEKISYKSKAKRHLPKEQHSIVYDVHEPIINTHTSRIVREMFKGRNGRITSNGTKFIFSQKLYCAYCERTFARNISRKERVYVQCKINQVTGENHCSNKKYLRLDFLEDFVLKEINNKIKEYYNLNSLEKSYYAKKVSSQIETNIDILTNEKQLLEIKVEESNSKFALLYEDRTKGILNVEEFIAIKNQYTKDIEDTKIRINQINQEISTLEENKPQKIKEESLLKKYKTVTKLDKKVIDVFISKITIGGHDFKAGRRDIQIKWTF